MAANPRTALRIGVAIALAFSGAVAAAEDEAPQAPTATAIEDAPLAQLERAFWLCDYVATTEGVTATPRHACRSVTEEVKRRKFGGGFRPFLDWWRENKDAEYARVRALRGE
jgi:hypothetical protein